MEHGISSALPGLRPKTHFVFDSLPASESIQRRLAFSWTCCFIEVEKTPVFHERKHLKSMMTTTTNNNKKPTTEYNKHSGLPCCLFLTSSFAAVLNSWHHHWGSSWPPSNFCSLRNFPAHRRWGTEHSTGQHKMINMKPGQCDASQYGWTFRKRISDVNFSHFCN